ncbi:penicillin-binding protein 1A [Endozoicomonadaceae bacterium StTr2]
MAKAYKAFKFLLWSGLLAFCGGLLIAASGYLYLSPSLPDVETLRDIRLQTPLRVYSDDGLLIAEFGEKRRSPVRIENTPPLLLKAFLAAEDDRFYKHHGVDPVGLGRATVQLISTGRIQSGGSTITMQVAKNFFLSHERVFSRKFNEILLALRIEQELDKDEILELYLNKIYLGNRSYGIEAAAQVYYGKTVNELDLAQMAMIAGLPKAPSTRNPIRSARKALSRRNWILSRMLELGYIDSVQYEQAVEQPVTASYHGLKTELDAPWIAEMVRQEMVERFGAEAYTDGYRVYTTVNSTLQKTANHAVLNGLTAYYEKHGYRGPLERPENPNISPEVLQTRLKEVPTLGTLRPAIVTQIGEQTAELLFKDQTTAELPWEGIKWAKKYININAFGYNPKTAGDVLKVGDLVQVTLQEDGSYRLAQTPDAQSSLISMDPETGAIRALVGGYNFNDSKFNRATQAIRQNGSVFKPFVYSAGIHSGLTASTLINDAPVVFTDDELEATWRPKNDNQKFMGPTRLRVGLYRSRNLVSIRLLQRVGIKPALRYLENTFGFPADALSSNLSLALGSAAMTPMQVTTGYSVIANGGYKVQPHLVKRIDLLDEPVFTGEYPTACYNCQPEPATEAEENSEPEALTPELLTLDTIAFPGVVEGESTTAEVIEALPLAPLQPTPPLRAERVMDERENYIINNMMRDVIRKGTGRRALALGRNDLGGKTGTTNGSRDVWFAGFNSQLLTTVWVGRDDNQTLGRWEYGANVALPIWLEYMKVALQDMPESPLPQPPGIVTLKIDPVTGEPAAANDQNAIFEVYRTEKAPNPAAAGSSSTSNGAAEDTPQSIF